jgi:putative DNA primase/helicase
MRKLYDYEIQKLRDEEFAAIHLQDFDFSKPPEERNPALRLSKATTAEPILDTVEVDYPAADPVPGSLQVKGRSAAVLPASDQGLERHCESAIFVESSGSSCSKVASQPPSLMEMQSDEYLSSMCSGPAVPAGPAPKMQLTKAAATDPESVVLLNGEPSRTTALPVAQEATLPVGYASFSDGIYVLADGDSSDPIFVCGPLRVNAQFSDSEGRGHGRLISVKSTLGTWHDIPVFTAELQRRPGHILATLLDHGLELAPDKQAKDRLLMFLRLSKPETQLQTVKRMGWVGGEYAGFVLGSALIGRQDVLPVSIRAIGGLAPSGDASSWRTEIGEKCVGNPLMVLATSLSFMGPLLAPLGMGSGGLHFRGASSSGKTTLLAIAASVWGSQRLISSWSGTRNGLEAIAGAMNDMLLPLDEIAEIAPRDLHGAIYMLGNGAGKARMTKDAHLADQAAWRLALISSGEISVRDKLKEARLETMAGHEVRLIDVEADSRAYGVFDNLHGEQSAAAFADNLRKSATGCHGTVGKEFIRLMIERSTVSKGHELEQLVRKHSTIWLDKLPVILDGQVERVAKRFAAIGLAGEIATRFGLTGWPQHEAFQAAELVFHEWHDRRHSIKREAADDYIKLLQDFLNANLQFLPTIGASNAAPGGPDPAGWQDSSRVYLSAETWSRLFPGASGTLAAKALLDLNLLVPGEDAGRLMRKGPRGVPGARKRFYTLIIDRTMSYRPE